MFHQIREGQYAMLCGFGKPPDARLRIITMTRQIRELEHFLIAQEKTWTDYEIEVVRRIDSIALKITEVEPDV